MRDLASLICETFWKYDHFIFPHDLVFRTSLQRHEFALWCAASFLDCLCEIVFFDSSSPVFSMNHYLCQCLHSTCLSSRFCLAAAHWPRRGGQCGEVHSLGRRCRLHFHNWPNDRGHPCLKESWQGGEALLHPSRPGRRHRHQQAPRAGIRVCHQGSRHKRQRAEVPGGSLHGQCPRDVPSR